MLRISTVDIEAASLPIEPAIRTGIHEIASAHCLLVTLKTDDGLVGEGYGFCFDRAKLQAIAQFAASLKPQILGRDPFQVERIWADLFRSLNFYGQGGVAILAMNPFDIACWDLIGKATQRPLYQIFGACRDKVPVYASGGLWLSASLEELESEARDFASAGFKAMKLRLGSKRWQDDLARVEAVRGAIPDDVALMVDANQSLTPSNAIRLGREMERFGLTWFEEPLPTWNDAGNAALAAALDTSVASGETEYCRYGIRRMVENRAADILMPDLQRMGGYTEMRKVVGFLATHDLPVSPHIFTEHSLHIVASAPNATWCEHMPWFGRLFNEEMTLLPDGMIEAPNRPGTGFTFDWDKLEQFRFAPKAE